MKVENSMIYDDISYEDVKDGQIVKLDNSKDFYMMITRKLRNKKPVYHFLKIDLKTGINTNDCKPCITHVYNKYGNLIKILKDVINNDTI